jgi:ZIP family zinc transporter
MSTGHILLLGAIAGATIFLGLPVARMQGLGPNVRSGLSALATGILVFLLWDVLSNAVDPIDASLHAHDWGRFAELSALGALGFTGGPRRSSGPVPRRSTSSSSGGGST